MELTERVKILENLYVGVLADSVRLLEEEGVLSRVIEAKRKEQLVLGAQKAAQLGISLPEEVFLKLSQITNCTAWKIIPEANGFAAEANHCKLCALAKKISGGSPCRLYCLDPMEGLVKGIAQAASYTVRETLWESGRCRVEVEIPS